MIVVVVVAVEDQVAIVVLRWAKPCDSYGAIAS